MSNLYDEKDGFFQVYGGATINATITEAIGIAKVRRTAVRFKFNGVTVSVLGNSAQRLIYRDWSRALNGSIDKQVGPYPTAELTAAEKAQDAKIEAANEARRQAMQAEYDAKMRAREADANAKLVGVTLDLTDADGWQKGLATNSDGYGRAVYTFAERWARLMQVEIAQGARLADIADRLVSEADVEGITGFMYGCAVNVLSHCWRHGEELRRWHNLKTQIRDEGERANESGGVLNPALLNLG